MGFVAHPEIEVPPDNVVIWRYVDLIALLAMQRQQSLSLTRSDRFPDDPWEGQWTDDIRQIERARSTIWQYEKIDAQAEAARRTYFVSCWHENSSQSDAFWRLYAGRAGIAIRTTVGRLKDSLGNPDKELYLGRVKYIDSGTDKTWSGRGDRRPIPPFWKRDCFRLENEVRILCINEGREAGGPPQPDRIPEREVLAVNTGTLIESIYLSPTLENWQAEVIEDAINLSGLGIVPVRSEINVPYKAFVLPIADADRDA